MSSLVQGLFGGSQSTQGTQSTSQSVNETNPALSSLATPLSGSLSQLLQQWGVSGPQYTGQTVAPLTGNQNSLLNSSTLTQPGAASNQYIGSVLNGSYMPGQPNQNPFTNAAIQGANTATNEGLATTLGNTLPGRFTANGQFIQPNTTGNGGSSAFDTAAALATQSAANADASNAASIENNAYNVGVQQQTAAAGLDQTAVNTSVQALQAQALPQLVQQYGLDQGVQLFQTGITNLLSLLQTIGAVQSPVLGTDAQSTGTAQSTASKGVIPDLYPKGA